MRPTGLTVGLDKKHFWQKHVASWCESNLSQVEYCRLNDLPIKNFGYWKLKESKAVLTHPRFFLW